MLICTIDEVLAESLNDITNRFEFLQLIHPKKCYGDLTDHVPRLELFRNMKMKIAYIYILAGTLYG